MFVTKNRLRTEFGEKFNEDEKWMKVMMMMMSSEK